MNDLYIQTPLLESVSLSKNIGIPVYLKMEALQPSGSYKDRGLGILVSDYVSRGFHSFVAASTGNSALSLAHACRVLKCRLKVVVPEKTSSCLLDTMRLFGAEVIVHGDDFESAEMMAKEIASKEKVTLIKPHDHPLIFEGISTMIYEIFGAGLKPGAILLSARSDLLAGVIQGLHACKWNDIAILTAETENNCPFATALFAEEAEAKNIAKGHKIYPHIVTDKAAFTAAQHFANERKILVEPALSAPLSVVYQSLPLLKTFSSILVIVSGGSNVSLSTFQN